MISKLEKQSFYHRVEVKELNDVISKTKEELYTCQTNFVEHKKESRKRILKYVDEIVELESKLKAFETVVYKTGESITTIQKFSINQSTKGQGLGLTDDKPRFLLRAL